MSMNKNRPPRNDEKAMVPFRLEILTIHEDELEVGPHGSQSVGAWLDELIVNSLADGEVLGKVTVDLTQHSEKFRAIKKAHD